MFMTEIQLRHWLRSSLKSTVSLNNIININNYLFCFLFIGLDKKTEGTLTQLIQSHMSKLLMRIDEENQSVSEKSSVHNKENTNKV